MSGRLFWPSSQIAGAFSIQDYKNSWFCMRPMAWKYTTAKEGFIGFIVLASAVLCPFVDNYSAKRFLRSFSTKEFLIKSYVYPDLQSTAYPSTHSPTATCFFVMLKLLIVFLLGAFFAKGKQSGVLDDKPTAANLKEIRKSFIQGGVVPDLLSNFNPKAVMKVIYPPETVFGTILFPGQRVPRNLTLQQPDIFILSPSQMNSYSTSHVSNYTFIFIDPDAPSRVNPSRGPFRHMLATNVKAVLHESGWNQLKFTATPISTYFPPSPPEGTGFHRYVFLLFEAQPSEESLQPLLRPDASRFNFNLENFISTSNIGDPISGTYMLTENDEDEYKNLKL
ncbi:hypothetical protein O181_018052 [Austropuccinia psidii MF-1]|uniref:Phosphatidylethanolamine-binding protein n=1 Tax=Austropuccinia psidii MF-1 TaxID=1389203 RepID=A0A9Q3C8T6_9BASI|nr:hypothetical protein [Austropuccinia psidii MF-1]